MVIHSFRPQAEPVDTFEHLTTELAISCSALLIYLEEAYDVSGNRYSDPVHGEPKAMSDARSKIERAKEALRRVRP